MKSEKTCNYEAGLSTDVLTKVDKVMKQLDNV